MIESADLEGAARLMNALAASANDEVVRIERWAADIPDELTAQHTGLALTRVARALAGGDNEAVAYWIDAAEKAIGNAEAEQQQVLRVSVALWHAVAAYTTGDLELATERCQAVLTLSGPGTNVNTFYAQGILGASLFATTGPEAALPHLEKAAATRRRLSFHDGGTTAQLAAAHAELGDWEQAEAIAAEAFSLPIPEGHAYPYNAPAHFAMAQVHDHRGNTDQAIAHAEKGLTMARNWVGPTFLCWGLFVMSQLVDGSKQQQLLTEAKQHIADSTGQQRLLSRIEDAQRHLTNPQPRTIGSGMILDPLTPRELDVLRLMRGDLSVRQIGVELYISHNTAKGYAKTIYQKLGVNSRRDAVTTATAADLI